MCNFTFYIFIKLNGVEYLTDNIFFQVAGIEYIYFMQRNHLNLRDRTLSIEASNISFSSRIAVVENCKYYVCFCHVSNCYGVDNL